MVCVSNSASPTDFLRGRRAELRNMPAFSPHSDSGVEGREGDQVDETIHFLNVTSWYAPVVWGDSTESERRRGEFAYRTFRTGLVVFVLGRYSQYLLRFVVSAERYFLPGENIVYYIMTDNLRSIPDLELPEDRELRPMRVAEMPQWNHLSKVRMSLLADAIRGTIAKEVEYLFCMDVDQEFINPVGTEILGDLVATLHPEYFGLPLYTFPYEKVKLSRAFVEEGEGDFYYTSELYGGLCAEVYALAEACSRFILQDSEMGYHAMQYEESYLNRYLINHRPTLLLSPEYSWWDSPRTLDVPIQRIVSLGRQCASLEPQNKETRKC
ncbi:hypothetical protein JZ751_025980 [Albula glossodonta]|uniref:Globoside alpha-1,3-N-acetylgalactosaminyltransferase 1-like n=1 Tax=Albula glossodonta TaxID=121402 RepID=A0A8T2NDE9_9TELE|nr:hypothetical protein JZ751_025980 [Albula glossodonta]